MALGVVQIERGGLAGDEADQALMRAQHGAVHGIAVQTLGGVEFERIVDAQDVDRAHLRHHVGGDQHYDLVQPLLRADLLRHGFAKPSQQDAGASRRASHCHKSSPTWPAYRGGRELALDSKRNNFIHSAASQVRGIARYRPNHTAKIVARFAAALVQAVYRIEPCFAKQKPCQCPDSEVRHILRCRASNFGIERKLENLLIWCGFGSEVRMTNPAAQMTRTSNRHTSVTV